MKKLVALAALAVMTSPHLISTAWAATQNITLSVPGMNCATCPITVKKALTKVSSVSKILVHLDRREARVTFDDAKANVEALPSVTQDTGYPSSVLAGVAK
jgi:mercuric ion binding protein